MVSLGMVDPIVLLTCIIYIYIYIKIRIHIHIQYTYIYIFYIYTSIVDCQLPLNAIKLHYVDSFTMFNPYC